MPSMQHVTKIMQSPPYAVEAIIDRASRQIADALLHIIAVQRDSLPVTSQDHGFADRASRILVAATDDDAQVEVRAQMSTFLAGWLASTADKIAEDFDDSPARIAIRQALDQLVRETRTPTVAWAMVTTAFAVLERGR